MARGVGKLGKNLFEGAKKLDEKYDLVEKVRLTTPLLLSTQTHPHISFTCWIQASAAIDQSTTQIGTQAATAIENSSTKIGAMGTKADAVAEPEAPEQAEEVAAQANPEVPAGP